MYFLSLLENSVLWLCPGDSCIWRTHLQRNSLCSHLGCGLKSIHW